jgi:hypothetical protein
MQAVVVDLVLELMQQVAQAVAVQVLITQVVQL